MTPASRKRDSTWGLCQAVPRLPVMVPSGGLGDPHSPRSLKDNLGEKTRGGEHRPQLRYECPTARHKGASAQPAVPPRSSGPATRPLCTAAAPDLSRSVPTTKACPFLPLSADELAHAPQGTKEAVRMASLSCCQTHEVFHSDQPQVEAGGGLPRGFLLPLSPPPPPSVPCLLCPWGLHPAPPVPGSILRTFQPLPALNASQASANSQPMTG